MSESSHWSNLFNVCLLIGFCVRALQVRLTPVKAVTFDFEVYFLMMMVLCWTSSVVVVIKLPWSVAQFIWTLEYRQIQSSGEYFSDLFHYLLNNISLIVCTPQFSVQVLKLQHKAKYD